MNRESFFLCSLALLGLVLLLPSRAKADISNGGGGSSSSGPTVTIQGEYPTLGSVVAGPVSGSLTSPIVFDGYTFIFTGGSVTYSTDTTGTYASTSVGGFNGFVLTFAGLPEPITNVTDDPGSQLDPNSISFTGDSFSFDLSGLTETAGQESIFDLTYAPTTATPEPTSALLFGLGILGLGFAAFRRKPADGLGANSL